MTERTFLQKFALFFRLWLRHTLRLLLLLLLVLVAVLLALQFPFVQTWLAQVATQRLSKKTGFVVHVERVSVNWLDAIVLEDVVIRDRMGEPMIAVEALGVDYNVFSMLRGKDIYLDEAVINSARVRLIKNGMQGALNITEFIRSLSGTGAKDTTRNGPAFIITRIDLNNSFFSFHNPARDSLEEGRFDHNHFSLDSISARVRDFRIIDDTIELDISKLRAIEPRLKFPIKELSTFFRYTTSNMEFRHLYAHINNSIVRDSLRFNYKNSGELSDFNEKVTIGAHLDSSVVTFRDLSIFAPSLRKYNETCVVSGDFKGKVVNFTVRNMDFAFGKDSRLKGRVSFDGLPDIDETFIDLDLKPSRLNTHDLQQYLDPQSFRRANKFGIVRFDGKFVGFPYDFVANGSFDTNLGRIISDINLKTHQSYYKGHLTTQGFKLGEFTGRQELLQLIDMSGKIEGTGFLATNADFKLDAKVSRLGVKGYDYKNITTNARFANRLFHGQLAVHDPNLVLTGEGQINLRDSTFQVKAILDTAFVDRLRLTDKELFVRSNISLDFEGLDIDKIEGSMKFNDTHIVYNNKDLKVNELLILSNKDSSRQRDIIVVSDLLNFKATGKFDFKQTSHDLQKMVREYIMHFENDQVKLDEYYREKKILDRIDYVQLAYRMEYDLVLKNITPLLRLFFKDIYVSENTRFTGEFISDYRTNFTLTGVIDTLYYDQYRLYGTDVDLATYKVEDSRDVHAAATVTSRSQSLKDFRTELLNINADWKNYSIVFDGFIKKQATDDKARVSGNLKFLDRRHYQLIINPSSFRVMSEEWVLPDTSMIDIAGREIGFNNLLFVSNNRSVALKGVISEDDTKEALLEVSQFDLNIFSGLIGKKLNGIVNGKARMRSFYKEIQLEGLLQAEGVMMDSVLIGNINSMSTWDAPNKRLVIDARVTREGTEIITLFGYYRSGMKNPLDVDAQLVDADIKMVEPFLSAVTSDMGGKASGTLKITGTPAYPLLKGKIFVAGGHFKVNYLNTVYYFDDNIYFYEDHIGMKRLKLRDDAGNRAFLDGGVYHDSFRNFLLQISGDFRNFKVLNTAASEETLYYGTAMATGDFSILGATSNLTIAVNARTEHGTRLYMPLDGYAGVEEKDFIRFVDKNDTTQVGIEASEKVDLSGIKLEFHLEITPVAYGEIIFDRHSGDIIRGNARGILNMEIDTKGDFKMYGGLEFLKGAYNFTFLNVVNKEFDIASGSSITWSGDPLGGMMDIQAAYTQSASLAPIITIADSSVMSMPEIRRMYPVRVNLTVAGVLMKPEIKFGVDVLDYPSVLLVDGVPISLESYVSAFKARLLSDEQELNKQVFSLMVLRRLSAENTFAGISQSAGGSVSELLSNQLSSWMSQVNENLEVDVNLNGLTAEALSTLQLRLSYSFLGGRLRVTRNGAFTNVQNQANVSSLAGDWTVEYMMTRDGRLRVKAYRKTMVGALNTAVENNSTSGVGLMYTRSFDKFSDLLPKRRKHKRSGKAKNHLQERDNEIK